MLISNFEHEVLASMERKLMKDDLQDSSEKLQLAANKIYKSAYIFKKSGLLEQSNKLYNILNIIAEKIKKNKSVKTISAEIEGVYDRIDLNSAEDMMKLNFGDINLSEDEIREIENELLNETNTFEDEKD